MNLFMWLSKLASDVRGSCRGARSLCKSAPVVSPYSCNIASTICIGVREYKGAERNNALIKVLLSGPTLASSARLSVLIAVV
jgi:hypothetical protein